MSSRIVTVENQHNADGAMGVRVDVRTGANLLRVSTLPRIPSPTFVGRNASLGALERKLREQREVVLAGPPGVGKSRLMVEYARRNDAAYPGGVFFLRFEDGTPPADLEKLLRGFGVTAYADEPFEDRCRRALHTIVAVARELGRVLMLYDAVPDADVFEQWLPPESADVQVVASTTFTGWSEPRMVVRVDRLSADDAQALVASILGDSPEMQRLQQTLVARADGITVELCAAAQAVRSSMRYGRQAKVEDLLSRPALTSYELAWKLLSERTRLLMKVACAYASGNPPMQLIRNALLSARGWSCDEVNARVDEARDRGFAGGLGDDLEIHQLVAIFVRGVADVSEADIRPALWSEFRRTASEFVEHPDRTETRELLLAHDLDPQSWNAWVADFTTVGVALIEAGRVVEAQPWLERAVGDSQAQDAHQGSQIGFLFLGDCLLRQGRYAEAERHLTRALEIMNGLATGGQGDEANVGACNHLLAKCLLHQRRYSAAREHYEKAVAIRSKGGSPYNHALLAESLHGIGMCLLRQRNRSEAFKHFREAAEIAARGDAHGIINHASCASYIHQAARCLLESGQIAEACEQFKTAAYEAVRGDAHGRADHMRASVSQQAASVCLVRLGDDVAALSWATAAFCSARRGDVWGQQRRNVLGTSANQIGMRLCKQQNIERARRWFERAVRYKEQGDGFGRVDKHSLAGSVREVGICLLRQNKPAEARLWLERAKNLGFPVARSGGGR